MMDNGLHLGKEPVMCGFVCEVEGIRSPVRCISIGIYQENPALPYLRQGLFNQFDGFERLVRTHTPKANINGGGTSAQKIDKLALRLPVLLMLECPKACKVNFFAPVSRFRHQERAISTEDTFNGVRQTGIEGVWKRGKIKKASSGRIGRWKKHLTKALLC